MENNFSKLRIPKLKTKVKGEDTAEKSVREAQESYRQMLRQEKNPETWPRGKGTGWARVPKKFWIGMLAGSTPAERVVAIELKVYANKRGECWPPISLMAKDTELNKDTIVKSLKALEKKELIKITRTKGHVNFYKFNHLSC